MKLDLTDQRCASLHPKSFRIAGAVSASESAFRPALDLNQ